MCIPLLTGGFNNNYSREKTLALLPRRSEENMAMAVSLAKALPCTKFINCSKL